MLAPWSPSEAQLQDLGYQELRRSGCDVTVLDMSTLIGSRERSRSILPGTFRMADHAEFETFVAGCDDETVFIDYLVGLDQIPPQMSHIFRILRRHKTRLMVIAAQPIPASAASTDPRTVRAVRLARWRKSSDVSAWARLAAVKTIALARRERLLYPLPDRVFSTRSDTLDLFAKRMSYPPERVVHINSLDQWRYRSYMQQRGDTPPITERIAVFLDEGASVHPDFEIMRREDRRLPHEEYGAELRGFFDEFESRTGLAVVVALHPRSDYDDPGFFGDRRAVRDSSIDLVARSSAVIIHATTAVNFAVLFDKPVMVIETAGMERVGYSVVVASVAGALGLVPVQVFKPAAVAAVEWDPSHWYRRGFPEYLDRYVRSSDAGDATVWETVSDSLRAERVWPLCP